MVARSTKSCLKSSVDIHIASPNQASVEPDFRWQHCSPEDWNDWRWQMRNSIRNLANLEKYLPLTDDERRGCQETAKIFRLGITPYYLSLIDSAEPFCPIRMQAIPVSAEAHVRPGELLDPLGEDRHRPVSALVHKYPDRVLLLAADACSVYCRHCTRRRITKGGELELNRATLAEAIQYIRSNREIRDVLISGGDPLLLSDARLIELLSAVKSIPHVEMIRFGTRIPVCLPMRITDSLVSLLRSFAPLYVVTHFNHPKEITSEAGAACERLVDGGVPVENQAVLMRRINSSARIMRELSHELLKLRVRPYYLHQMDVAQGLEHLRTPLRMGIQILEEMRGHTTGLAVPHFAVDLPGGGGKVTLQPNYLVETNAESTIFRNYRGQQFVYPEPQEQDCDCPYDVVWLQKRANR